MAKKAARPVARKPVKAKPGKARPFKANPTRRGGDGWFRRLVVTVLLAVLIVPPLSVIVYRFMPPPITILMIERAVQGHGLDYRWRPLDEISLNLVQAAVASEDSHYCEHHGFDFGAMQKAMAHNEKRPSRIKGGSTISQQTAKNAFLWPGRDYVRKGIEAGYTVLIEAIWGKRRIMEVYLNIIEFGPGIYGAQAASQRFFHEDASQLTPVQAAHLIAVLPKPLKWKAENSGPYIARRSRVIDTRIGTVRQDGLAQCVAR